MSLSSPTDVPVGCPHPEAPEFRRTCPHLAAAVGTEVEYCRAYTGRGLDYDLLCLSCGRAPEESAARVRLCSACFGHLEDEGYFEAVHGRPEIRSRPSGLHFEHRPVSMQPPLPEPLSAIEPVAEASGSVWIALTSAGRLLRLDFDAGRWDEVAQAAPERVDLGEALSVQVSAGGEMVAVAEKRGTRGAVLDLRTGRETMLLQRGNHHVGHCTFPLAFFRHRDRLLLVHGTNWNRLDVSDPETGELLTEREPTSYRRGEEQPQHYLDYFHGRPLVSPEQDRIYDDGWMWHPTGIPRVWSLRCWVEENVWESEDGPSVCSLTYRDYFWDGPACWADNRTLVLWGYGDDDERLIPAALVLNIEAEGTERALAKRPGALRWFPGPVGSLFFDGYLFAISPAEGTTVWDLETGERLLADGGFHPIGYHPGARRFLSRTDDGAFVLSRLAR